MRSVLKQAVIDLKLKLIRKHKEGQFILIQGTMIQIHITSLNIKLWCTPFYIKHPNGIKNTDEYKHNKR